MDAIASDYGDDYDPRPHFSLTASDHGQFKVENRALVLIGVSPISILWSITELSATLYPVGASAVPRSPPVRQGDHTDVAEFSPSSLQDLQLNNSREW